MLPGKVCQVCSMRCFIPDQEIWGNPKGGTHYKQSFSPYKDGLLWGMWDGPTIGEGACLEHGCSQAHVEQLRGKIRQAAHRMIACTSSLAFLMCCEHTRKAAVCKERSMSSKAWPFAQGHVKALACHLKGWWDGVGWMDRWRHWRQ